MYNCSNAFHAAIAAGNEQKALLIFPNCVFTDEDIVVDQGIEMDDNFNMEEDLAIGQALSNEIHFSLVNEDRLLNDYEFGDFTALLGVHLSTETYTQQGTIYVQSPASNVYIATSTSPYLTRNGTAMVDAPTGKLVNILIYNDVVYCFRENGYIFTYKDSTGERINLTNDKSIFDSSIAGWVTGYYISTSGAYVEGSNYRYSGYYFPVKASTRYIARYTKTQNAGHHVTQYDANKNFITRTVLSTASDTKEEHKVHFTTAANAAYIRFTCGTETPNDIYIGLNLPYAMIEKFKRASYYGACFHDNILTLNQNGVSKTYEFVPLGMFVGKRPKAPDVIQIDMTCYDFMTKFDKDMNEVSITYPITISDLFVALCTAAGVQYELPSTFINGTAVVNSKPKDFDNATMRDVLKWIAEAACSNARFNRDGKLILDWIRTGTGQVLGTGNYMEFTPYWYETKEVTSLYNRDTQGNSQTNYGAGDEAYLIQDNPLLRGVG